MVRKAMELSSPASLAPRESSPVFPAHNRIGPVARARTAGYVVCGLTVAGARLRSITP
jgi:hypothetical protein